MVIAKVGKKPQLEWSPCDASVSLDWWIGLVQPPDDLDLVHHCTALHQAKQLQPPPVCPVPQTQMSLQ